MKTPCPFCVEWNHPGYFSAFAGRIWRDEHRILRRDDHSFVIPGYGPQVYPYALVVPARHCTGLVGSSSDTERGSIFDALDALLASGLFPSQRLSVFEHGGCGSSGGACIEHAHLHVVDGSLRIREWFQQDQPLASTCHWSRHGDPACVEDYLFAGEYDGRAGVDGILAVNCDVESQYFRRLIADTLRLDSWDWRAGMNAQWMRKLADEFWSRSGRPVLDVL